MNNQAFEVGDVVQLKSGGPKMTIEGNDEDGNLRCTWFDGTKKSESSFSPKSLIHVDQGSSAGIVLRG